MIAPLPLTDLAQDKSVKKRLLKVLIPPLGGSDSNPRTRSLEGLTFITGNVELVRDIMNELTYDFDSYGDFIFLDPNEFWVDEE